MNDLGKGSIGKLLFRLAVPSILAQLVNALYNIIDRIFIGRIPEVGPTALTGVGVTFAIIMVISAFSALVGMGGAPLAAIKMGEKNQKDAEKIMTNSFVVLMCFAAVLTCVFLIFKHPMLMAFGASSETVVYGDAYLEIYLLGTVFVQIAIGMNAFITAQGYARTSMLTVIIGAVMNIVLDPIFIFVLGMGVRGAALATVISQGVSAVWVMAFLLGKRTTLRIRKSYIKPDFKVIGSVMALGISPFIMQSTESLVNVVFNSTLQRCGGDIAVGSMTIITSVMQFSLMPLNGLTQGAQPIISFNFGAGNKERVKKTFRLLFICCMIYAASISAVCALVPGFFVKIFVPAGEEAADMLIKTASGYLPIFMAGVWMFGAQSSCQSTFLALGQAKVSLFLAILRKIILLIPFVYLFSYFKGTTGVFMAEPFADILAASTTLTLFLLNFNKILNKRGKDNG